MVYAITLQVIREVINVHSEELSRQWREEEEGEKEMRSELSSHKYDHSATSWLWISCIGANYRHEKCQNEEKIFFFCLSGMRGAQLHQSLIIPTADATTAMNVVEVGAERARRRGRRRGKKERVCLCFIIPCLTQNNRIKNCPFVFLSLQGFSLPWWTPPWP